MRRETVMEQMKAKNYRFPQQQLDDLEKMSLERGVKEPELVRRALDEFLSKWKKERSKNVR
jgi:hypothetical protein